MKEEINSNIKIDKNNCKFCQFYEEDYMPTEMGNVHLEWCHNHNNKYKFDSKKQIMSFEIHNCDGFKEEVKYYLKKIEQEYNITIVYAVESGSRAWGFANDDSDYDIRFIYKHNNLKEYFHVNGGYEDVMIFNDGIYDIVGWDIKKSLYLHYKNNPSLYEWLNSSYVYVKDDTGIFKNLPSFNNKSLLHHYYNMGNNTWKKYCKNYIESDDLLKLSKKFLYVIRCILNWSIIYEGITPLNNFHKLIGQNIKYHILSYSSSKNISLLENLYTSYSQERGIPKNLQDEFFFLFENLEKWILKSLEYMINNTEKYMQTSNKGYEKYDEVLHQVLGV